MAAAPGHALMVGGTGMLSAAADALAADGWRVSHIARHATAFADGRAGQAGFDADYHDADAFGRALTAALAWGGPAGLGIAWFRTLKLEAPRLMAQALGAPGRPARLFQVLGSRTAHPDHPDRLPRAATVAEGLPDCRLRQVVLGFRTAPAGVRANTNEEISAGVLDAIAADRQLTVVGKVDPWPLQR
jgi:hypothetical protein